MLDVKNSTNTTNKKFKTSTFLDRSSGTPMSSKLLGVHSPYLDDECAQTHDLNPVRVFDLESHIPLSEAYRNNMLTAPAICLGFSVHAQTHKSKDGVDLINVDKEDLKYVTKFRPIGYIPKSVQNCLKMDSKIKIGEKKLSKLGYVMVVKSPKAWTKDEVSMVFELAGKALQPGIFDIWDFLENQFCYNGVANAYKVDKRTRALLNIQNTEVEIQIVDSRGKIYHKHTLEKLFKMVDLNRPEHQSIPELIYFKQMMSDPDSQPKMRQIKNLLKRLEMQMEGSGLYQLAKMDFGLNLKNEKDKVYGNVMSFPNPSDPNLTCVQEFLIPALLSSMCPYGKNSKRMKYLHRRTIMEILMINKDKDHSKEYKLIESKLCKFGSPYLDRIEVSKHVICFSYRIEQKDVNEVIKLKREGYKLEKPSKKQMKKTNVPVTVTRYKLGKLIPVPNLKDHKQIEINENFTFRFASDITHDNRKKRKPIKTSFKKTPPPTKLETCDWLKFI